MAPTPVAGGINVAQQVQQQVQKPDVAKTGASKFDQLMANKAGEAQGVQGPQAAQNVQNVQKTQQVQKVEQAGKIEEMGKANAVKQNDPTTARRQVTAVEQVLTQMETRNANMEKFVQNAISGKVKLNHQQLLGLQAKVSQYSLELDLTGKVVEKATSGLKDTLRTQV